MNNDDRRRELAKIHLAAKQLGMQRDAYEQMLWAVARVKSAGNLDAAGRARVLDHLKACGFRFTSPRKPRTDRPHNLRSDDRGPQLKKIEALLADSKRPWAYVDSMAQKMFGVDRVAFCGSEQLRSLIAALVYDAKRREAKEDDTSLS